MALDRFLLRRDDLDCESIALGIAYAGGLVTCERHLCEALRDGIHDAFKHYAHHDISVNDTTDDDDDGDSHSSFLYWTEDPSVDWGLSPVLCSGPPRYPESCQEEENGRLVEFKFVEFDDDGGFVYASPPPPPPPAPVMGNKGSTDASVSGGAAASPRLLRGLKAARASKHHGTPLSTKRKPKAPRPPVAAQPPPPTDASPQVEQSSEDSSPLTPSFVTVGIAQSPSDSFRELEACAAPRCAHADPDPGMAAFTLSKLKKVELQACKLARPKDPLASDLCLSSSASSARKRVLNMFI
ncbi:unnamed protein product [Notodromas monacha]|uniref:Uncharacterized protein n=1 Tax=Notodromas monacha TaxID=399045 RepID=A0A7R9GC49_9CRUS|nr:unnamed protein product [Notodromas monacha]CAG0917104.1 unnamed protein product [Notodromas monacha]